MADYPIIISEVIILNETFRLVFKNHELVIAMEFLRELELKASDSRHRTKLVKELSRYNDDLYKEQMVLIEEYGQRDSENNLVLAEDKQHYLIDATRAVEYQNASNELLREDVIITGGAYESNIKKLGAVLENYTGELHGQSADIYDRILDEYEKNEAAQ